MQHIWKTQQWPQNWKRSASIPLPKKSNAKECSNYCIIALISHVSKVMLKILQARLQQYVNCKLPDIQAGFRKGRGTWDQIANICWFIEKQENSRKTSTSALLITPKPFVDHNRLWKIHKEMRIPDHLTSLLRNLYADLKGTVKIGLGTTHWFQIRKGVHQGCVLKPCSFNLHAEYIMWNAGLDGAQARIKIAGRNVSNLRYTDDTTLVVKGSEEQKASWWKRRVKKSWLKARHSQN